MSLQLHLHREPKQKAFVLSGCYTCTAKSTCSRSGGQIKRPLPNWSRLEELVCCPNDANVHMHKNRLKVKVNVSRLTQVRCAVTEACELQTGAPWLETVSLCSGAVNPGSLFAPLPMCSTLSGSNSSRFFSSFSSCRLLMGLGRK